MWCKVITNGRVFDERRDTPRFRAAFMTLAGRRTWPVPQDFIEALPSNVTPIHKPKLLDDERTKKARLVAFDEIRKTLGIKKPEGDDAA
ncbi:hypothetical protein [Luteibacter sp. SG786]|uniref:hypothetical protein n=1 Tax=Luteibacter sp. SG786 TaxID=2587130 RepID=UPI001423BB78|nr:hypothetical protein [Luteibacter sp. SG786]NII54378.1 hypothetical protein [Luteibacter sp. SG786]